ncbi:hypothetical protein MXB_253 [Myxobolus squamalis]|nr:hypothetical protein MXB_253 [Myxobolus squamalis]
MNDEIEEKKLSPIFRRFNTGFSKKLSIEKGNITHFEIANSCAIAVLDSYKILVIKNFPFQVSNRDGFKLILLIIELNLLNKNTKIKKLYFHPMGTHAIILTDRDELLMFNVETKQLSQLIKSVKYH